MRPFFLIAALMGPVPAGAAVDGPLAPLAFLAGHCWKGVMPDGKATDEHCFAWIFDGKFLRDRHVVRDPAGKAPYEGETIYYWNSADKQLEYFYITANGGTARGRASPDAEGIDFPAATLTAGGRSFTFRGRWKRLGETSYEVLREYQTDKGWAPVRMEMRRVDRAPGSGS